MIVLGPLLLVVAWAGSFALEKYQQTTIQRDLDRRARLLYRSTEEILAVRLERGDKAAVDRLLSHMGQDELIQGVFVCDPLGHTLASSTVDSALSCETVTSDDGSKEPLWKNYHISSFPLVREDKNLGQLLLVSDGGPWFRRTERMRLGLILLFVATGAAVIAASTWAAKWTLSQPLRDLRLFLKGGPQAGDSRPILQRLQKSDFAPLVKDLIKINADRGSSPNERPEGLWNPARLRAYVKRQFDGTPLCVISNREPYMHVKNDHGGVTCVRPASGLVTGVEPILKACDGLWIAHGAGSADAQTVDPSGRIRVPQENPEYTLHRVWLNEPEEMGYYYGFSNEGLWPLCHISHQRPRFEANDWEQYKAVNEKFAEAFMQETQGAPAVVLVQDYHFALLPRLIKELSPESLVLLFWHIPWPNAEAFGICPWKQDILHGMLGADVLGFHTQYHCNNFVDTVDRFMESRIDREFLNIQLQGKECRVRPFPISIDPDSEQIAATNTTDIRALNNLAPATRVILGVDRVDYTKGIPERLRAMERFAELRPDLARETVFIQIGAPSRTTIAAYRNLNTEVWEIARAINERFRPILGRDLVILKLEHHNPEQLQPYYAQADICLVTPLHDGMNLVAKEYIAARTRETGVLILSEFAGASRELREALLINPYSSEDVASRIIAACEMPPSEQRDRMRLMRRTIADHNVYRWAYSQLHELLDVRRLHSLVLDLPA